MSTQARIQAQLAQLVGHTILTAAIATDVTADGSPCETLTLETEAQSVRPETRNGYRESWIELAK